MPNLPFPNQEEVVSFRALCREKFDIEVTTLEALEVATKLAQIFYIQNFEGHPHCMPFNYESGLEHALPEDL